MKKRIDGKIFDPKNRKGKAHTFRFQKKSIKKIWQERTDRSEKPKKAG